MLALGEGGEGSELNMSAVHFHLQPTDSLVQFQGTSKWVYTLQM